MDGYERGERIGRGMVDIYFASKDYMDTYRAFRRVQKRGEEDEEKLFERQRKCSQSRSPILQGYERVVQDLGHSATVG